MEYLSPNIIVNLAASLHLAAFFFGRQMILRLLLFCGNLLYAGYYLIANTPLWNAFAWSILFCSVNGVWMLHYIIQRHQAGKIGRIDRPTADVT